MDELELLKANLGINGAMRDTYLNSLLESVKRELEKIQGLKMDEESQVLMMFIVDLSAWRFRNRGAGNMPRNLQYRLHNLIIQGGVNDVD